MGRGRTTVWTGGKTRLCCCVYVACWSVGVQPPPTASCYRAVWACGHERSGWVSKGECVGEERVSRDRLYPATAVAPDAYLARFPAFQQQPTLHRFFMRCPRVFHIIEMWAAHFSVLVVKGAEHDERHALGERDAAAQEGVDRAKDRQLDVVLVGQLDHHPRRRHLPPPSPASHAMPSWISEAPPQGGSTWQASV